MRLTQRAPTCPACGRTEPPRARWCGDCGAPLPSRGRSTAVATEVDRADPGGVRPRRARWRIGSGVALVVALVVGTGLVAGPSTGGDPDLLGRLDDATGRSSLLPPSGDLQLLWQRAVDAADAPPRPAGRLVDLGDRAVVADEVVDVDGGADPVVLPPDAAPGHDGVVLAVDGREVVTLDVRSGVVRSRAAIHGGGTWQPHGVAHGRVADLGVLTDPEGRLGAVARDGAVRWVGEPDWVWDGVGDGTDWLVVTGGTGPVQRVLVVDGRTGRLHRDVGPTGTVHDPVVHGDTLVWVDPHPGVDPGLGSPVEVHGIRLDGSGQIWTVTDLPPTSGVLDAVRLTAVEDSVAVAYWTAGQATTATWLAPADGTRVGAVSVVGTGSSPEGWPVTAIVGDALAHVDPVRQQVRVVDRRGSLRWALPALPGEGLVASGELVLVRTPPRGTALQSRLRLLDASTGSTRWDRVTTDTQTQRLVGVLDGHVGVSPGPWPAPLRTQSWLHLDTGRRRAGPGLAAEALGLPPAATADLSLLGSVAVGPRVHPVLVRPDGSVVRPAGSGAVPSVAELLGTSTRDPRQAAAVVTDDRAGIHVGTASVLAEDPATGRRLWRTASPVALRQDLALLLEEVVVAVGLDGVPRAWDRDEGALRWTAAVTGTTAMTAGGEQVVLGTGTGEVVVLDDDGVVLQRHRVGHGAVEDVAVVDGRVVATVGGEVVGLGRGSAFVEPVDRVEVP